MAELPASFTLIQPDDWHCHFRDGAMLARTVADANEQHFGRVLAMPNLKPPICTVLEALAYQQTIINNNSTQ